MDVAHAKTDKRLEEMEEHLTAIYTRANKEVEETAKEYFDKFKKKDEEKRKLVEQGKLSEKEYKTWRQNKIAYGKRYDQLQDQIAQQMLNVNRTAMAYINGQLPDVYCLNYNALSDSVDGLGGYSFTLTDPYTIKNLAANDETLLPYKEVDGKKDVRWNTRQVNAEVLQGILQGDSIPKIAKRLENVTEKNRVTAIRNARTTVTSAENKGRFDSYFQAQKDGIVLKKKWISSDQPGRTRDWHLPAAFDHLTVDIDKPFKNEIGPIRYPGDPEADGANVWNCRCTMAAEVKGFRKPNGEVVLLDDAEEPKQQAKPKPKAASKRKTAPKPKPKAAPKKKPEPRGIRTNYTGKEVEGMSRARLEKIANEIYIKTSMADGLSRQEAQRRFDLLISGNTTPQLRKYIVKYGKTV